jgi:hypothetical protein
LFEGANHAADIALDRLQNTQTRSVLSEPDFANVKKPQRPGIGLAEITLVFQRISRISERFPKDLEALEGRRKFGRNWQRC